VVLEPSKPPPLYIKTREYFYFGLFLLMDSKEEQPDPVDDMLAVSDRLVKVEMSIKERTDVAIQESAAEADRVYGRKGQPTQKTCLNFWV